MSQNNQIGIVKKLFVSFSFTLSLLILLLHYVARKRLETATASDDFASAQHIFALVGGINHNHELEPSIEFLGKDTCSRLPRYANFWY